MARSFDMISPEKSLRKSGSNSKKLKFNQKEKAFRASAALGSLSIPNKMSIGQKKIRRNYYENLIENEPFYNRQQSMCVPNIGFSYNNTMNFGTF